MTTTKTLKTRDSATSLLRKMGINSRDYNLFIAKDEAGLFVVNTDLATKHLADLAVQTAPKELRQSEASTRRGSSHPMAGAPMPSVEAPKVEPKVEAEKPAKTEDKRTVTSVCRAMIRAGETNKTIWDVLVAEFKLDAKKRHYPAWYRHQMRNAGEKV